MYTSFWSIHGCKTKTLRQVFKAMAKVRTCLT
uniref:Uncharacterized protein n=1 Tax=Arundo donax TaxID=35708 RepID=A0A0A8YLW8_ARUDO